MQSAHFPRASIYIYIASAASRSGSTSLEAFGLCSGARRQLRGLIEECRRLPGKHGVCMGWVGQQHNQRQLPQGVARLVWRCGARTPGWWKLVREQHQLP